MKRKDYQFPRGTTGTLAKAINEQRAIAEQAQNTDWAHKFIETVRGAMKPTPELEGKTPEESAQIIADKGFQYKKKVSEIKAEDSLINQTAPAASNSTVERSVATNVEKKSRKATKKEKKND